MITQTDLCVRCGVRHHDWTRLSSVSNSRKINSFTRMLMRPMQSSHRLHFTCFKSEFFNLLGLFRHVSASQNWAEMNPLQDFTTLTEKKINLQKVLLKSRLTLAPRKQTSTSHRAASNSCSEWETDEQQRVRLMRKTAD